MAVASLPGESEALGTHQYTSATRLFAAMLNCGFARGRSASPQPRLARICENFLYDFKSGNSILKTAILPLPLKLFSLHPFAQRMLFGLLDLLRPQAAAVDTTRRMRSHRQDTSGQLQITPLLAEWPAAIRRSRG